MSRPIIPIPTEHRYFHHGETKAGKGGKPTPEYCVWGHIRQRCYNPRYPYYKSYGGRGITVCERWRTSFLYFLEDILRDIGRRPSKKHSIERIDNNGNYEPGNVKWATEREQHRNTSRNIIVEYNGEKRKLFEVCEEFGFNYHTINSRRRKGCPPSELFAPLKRIRKKRIAKSKKIE